MTLDTVGEWGEVRVEVLGQLWGETRQANITPNPSRNPKNFRAQILAKSAPKSAQNLSFWGSRGVPGESRGASWEGPGESWGVPGEPRRPQQAPKTAQDAPKRPQEAPKTAPKGPKIRCQEALHLGLQILVHF